LQDHDQLIKQTMDDAKAAVSDLIARRDAALAAAATYDASVAGRLAEAARLQSKLAAAATAKAASDERIATLQRDLLGARKAAENASARESEANGEIDEANSVIQSMQEQTAALEQRLQAKEEELTTERDVNRGLEDDKEELQAALKAVQEQLEDAGTKHKAELERLASEASSSSSRASSKASALQEQARQLGEQNAALTRRVSELERAANLAEVDLARVRADRDAAADARAALQADLERHRRQQGALASRPCGQAPSPRPFPTRPLLHSAETSQAGMSSALEQFNRQQEIHLQREKELHRTIDACQERVQALSVSARQAGATLSRRASSCNHPAPHHRCYPRIVAGGARRPARLGHVPARRRAGRLHQGRVCGQPACRSAGRTRHGA